MIKNVVSGRVQPVARRQTANMQVELSIKDTLYSGHNTIKPLYIKRTIFLAPNDDFPILSVYFNLREEDTSLLRTKITGPKVSFI